LYSLEFFFYFQAEDGIRDFHVTGVQTCALPISLHSFNDMYTIQYEPLGINEKYTEHTWSFPLEAGGTMSHRARRVVKLNAEDDQSYIDGDLEITGALWADNFAFGTVNVTPPAT